MFKLNYHQDFKPLMKLVIPLILTGLVGGLVYFFQTLFLAHIGAKALAAGALVSWLNWLLVVIIFGILGAINVLVANYYGAKNFRNICYVIRDGFLLSLVLCIPTFYLFWKMPPIFILLGQKAAIADLATPYLHALAWGLLPNFLVIVLLETMIGIGHTRIVFLITILSVVSTLFFNYVLMFGKWGFPNLGIAGAGWGFTIGNFITLVVFSSYILLHSNYRHFLKHVFHMGKPFFLLELITIGLPMGLMYCVEVGFFFVLSLKMGSYSHELLAANQIALQYLGILIGAIFSIAQAITVRMGHLLGAAEYDDAYHASQAGCIISLLFILFFSLIEFFAPQWLIGLDFDLHLAQNQLLIMHAKTFLLLCGIFQILEAIRISLFGALRAFKDTHFTLWNSLITLWLIALPLGLFMEHTIFPDGRGLWWGMIFANILSIFILKQRLKKTVLLNR